MGMLVVRVVKENVNEVWLRVTGHFRGSNAVFITRISQDHIYFDDNIIFIQTNDLPGLFDQGFIFGYNPKQGRWYDKRKGTYKGRSYQSGKG